MSHVCNQTMSENEHKQDEKRKIVGDAYSSNVTCPLHPPSTWHLLHRPSWSGLKTPPPWFVPSPLLVLLLNLRVFSDYPLRSLYLQPATLPSSTADIRQCVTSSSLVNNPRGMSLTVTITPLTRSFGAHTKMHFPLYGGYYAIPCLWYGFVVINIC